MYLIEGLSRNINIKHLEILDCQSFQGFISRFDIQISMLYDPYTGNYIT